MSLRRLAQVAVQPVVALSRRAPTRRMAHRLDSLRPPYRAFANEIPGMKDEYGDLDDSGHSFILDEDFHLEAGGILSRAEVRYQTWGTLNATKDNCLVCHALTGNQSLDTWWGECLGLEKRLTPISILWCVPMARLCTAPLVRCRLVFGAKRKQALWF